MKQNRKKQKKKKKTETRMYALLHAIYLLGADMVLKSKLDVFRAKFLYMFSGICIFIRCVVVAVSLCINWID